MANCNTALGDHNRVCGGHPCLNMVRFPLLCTTRCCRVLTLMYLSQQCSQCVILLQVSATPLAARSFMAFRQRILFEAADLIKKHGAEVANNIHAQVIMESRENISQVGLPM